MVLMMSLASAMYAGESETFDLEYEIVNCSIIDNTYNLEGLNLTWENTNVTISTAINYKPDTFTISCWVIEYKEEVKVRSYSRGRSSSSSSPKTIYIVDNVSGKDYGDTSKYPTYNNEETPEEPKEEAPTQIEETPEPPTEEEPEEKPYLKLWLLGGLLILVMFILFKFSRKRQSYSFEHASHEEENINEKEVE